MFKRKSLALIVIFIFSAVSTSIYFNNKFSLPENIKDIITYEYKVVDYQKKVAFIDKSDHLAILELDADNYISQNELIENLAQYKTMPENKLNSLMPYDMFESISEDYLTNYYYQDKDNLIMFILLTENRIAIFYY